MGLISRVSSRTYEMARNNNFDESTYRKNLEDKTALLKQKNDIDLVQVVNDFRTENKVLSDKVEKIKAHYDAALKNQETKHKQEILELQDKINYLIKCLNTDS